MAFDANDLSPHEHFVVERTRDGEVADFTPMIGVGGAKPAIRAGFLRKLMLELDPAWSVRAPGVRLKGVRIDGVLDLTDCSGAGGAGLPALSLEGCDMADMVDLSHARLARLSFSGSRLRRLVGVETTIGGECDLCNVAPLSGGDDTLTVRLRGMSVGGDLLARGAKFARAAATPDEDAVFLQGARITGNVLLDEGFEAIGCVWIAGAAIGGRLQLNGASLSNRRDDGGGVALAGGDVRIGGALTMGAKFKAEGEVNLLGAHIGGDVDLSEGVFRNENGSALALNNAEIGGQLIAIAKFTGELSLQGAEIGRNLDLRGAEIANPATPRGEQFFVALSGASLRVRGAALFQGANIKGEVFLADARIDGYLAFGGGRFINPGSWAIRAPNVRVGGNLTLKIDDSGFAPHGQKTVIEGGAKFDRARIEGALSWLNLELRGAGPAEQQARSKGAVFSFADAEIGGAVEARNLTCSQESFIDASGARCNALDDDLKTGWGVERAGLDLEGFAYGRLDSRAKDDRARTRLNWLRRTRREGQRFSPQPYTALGEVYARDGRREDARRVLLAQHDQRTFLASAGPLTWFLSSAFGLIAGYGFAPIRAVRALALFLAIGVAGVLAMDAQHALVTPQGRACNGAVEPALYAVDVALPIIDLGQESACGPGRAPNAKLFSGVEIPNGDWRLFEGAALWKWAKALYAIFGAILSALAIVTFSGVLKPRDN